jgi:hypothetical protein
MTLSSWTMCPINALSIGRLAGVDGGVEIKVVEINLSSDALSNKIINKECVSECFGVRFEKDQEN